MTPGTRLQRLREIILTTCIRTGDTYTLTSGRTSDFYCNLKTIMGNPEALALMGQLLHERCIPYNPAYVAGMELGAVPLLTALSTTSHYTGHPIRSLIIRKETKEHGTKNRIEGLQGFDSLFLKPILLIEDVTTTGNSALKAAEVLRQHQAKIIGVISIVDRQEGAAERFAQHGIPFHPLLTRRDFESR